MKMNKKYLLAIPALALAGAVVAGSVSAANTTDTTTPTAQAQQRGPGGPGGFGGKFMMHGDFGGDIGDSDRFVERLTSEASILGISLDEMKTYWSQGKNIRDIATEKGITDEQLKTKLETAAEARATASLKALVDKGVITQAQADARATAMKNMKTKMAEQMKNRPQLKRGTAPTAPTQTQPTQS